VGPVGGRATILPYCPSPNLSLLVHPTDGRRVYVDGINYAPGTRQVAEEGLWRTLDGGDSWQLLATPFPRIYVVAFHPADPAIMFAGGFPGPGTAERSGGAVAWSRDGGETWASLPALPATLNPFGLSSPTALLPVGDALFAGRDDGLWRLDLPGAVRATLPRSGQARGATPRISIAMAAFAVASGALARRATAGR
jgi:hypothetical protein